MVRRSRAFWWGALASIVVGCIAFASGISVALYWGTDIPFAQILGPTGAVRRATPDNIRKEFDVYWQTWDLVEQNFYRDKPLDHKKMMYASITGMMRALGDDYTFFQEPEDASKTREQMDGQFEGIGAYIGFKDGKLYISSPIEESPAAKAGLLPDDVIVKVNGADVVQQLAKFDADAATKQAAQLIQGPRGSTVKLTILRPGTQQTLEFSIVRDAIPLITVQNKMLEGNVAYIQVSQFEGTTMHQLDKALKQIQALHPKGIILDLRNNPGGLLDAAQEMLGRFVKDGTALYERFANGEEKRFDVTRSPGATTDFDTPMIVLVNANSASASEIVAGALRDRGRAALLGERTYGKGSVQTVARLSDQSSARITIARWLTPNREQIHKKGIQPEEYVPYDNNARYKVALPQSKPADPPEANDAQLYWAVKQLAAGERPPALPTPTPQGQATATPAR